MSHARRCAMLFKNPQAGRQAAGQDAARDQAGAGRRTSACSARITSSAASTDIGAEIRRRSSTSARSSTSTTSRTSIEAAFGYCPDGTQPAADRRRRQLVAEPDQSVPAARRRRRPGRPACRAAGRRPTSRSCWRCMSLRRVSAYTDKAKSALRAARRSGRRLQQRGEAVSPSTGPRCARPRSATLPAASGAMN